MPRPGTLPHTYVASRPPGTARLGRSAGLWRGDLDGSAGARNGGCAVFPRLRFSIESGRRRCSRPRFSPRRRTRATIRAADRLGGTSANGSRGGKLRPSSPVQRRVREARRSAASPLCAGRCGGARELSTRRDSGTRDLVAQKRHAVARGQLPGDAFRRPPHPPLFTNVNPEGRVRSWRLATTSTSSRRDLRTVCACLCRRRPRACVLRITKTPRSP